MQQSDGWNDQTWSTVVNGDSEVATITLVSSGNGKIKLVVNALLVYGGEFRWESKPTSISLHNETSDRWNQSHEKEKGITFSQTFLYFT